MTSHVHDSAVRAVTILDPCGRALLSYDLRGPETGIGRSLLSDVRPRLATLIGAPTDRWSSWPLPRVAGEAPDVERRAIATFAVCRDEDGREHIDRTTERHLTALIQTPSRTA